MGGKKVFICQKLHMRTQTHQNSNCQQQIELLWYTWGHQVPAHPFELQASKKKHAFSQAFELNFAAMLKWILYIYIYIHSPYWQLVLLGPPWFVRDFQLDAVGQRDQPKQSQECTWNIWNCLKAWILKVHPRHQKTSTVVTSFSFNLDKVCFLKNSQGEGMPGNDIARNSLW